MSKILEWAGAGFKTVAVALVSMAVTAAVILAVQPVQLTSTPTPTASPTGPGALPTGPHCPTEDSCRPDYYGGSWHIVEVTP